jgi:hypothetical protein
MTGAGEEVMGATVAAIANAFFDATGVRMRQYPMTPVRVAASACHEKCVKGLIGFSVPTARARL